MEILALIAFIAVVVPFVLPIASWVSSRRTRQRVQELQDALDEQGRTLETLKVQLAQLRREAGVAPTARHAPETKAAEPGSAAAPAPLEEPTPREEVVAAAQPPAVEAPPPATPLPVAPAADVSPAAIEEPRPAAPPPRPTEEERPVSPAPPPRPPAEKHPVLPPPPPPRPTVPPQPPQEEPPSGGFDWESLVGVRLFSAFAGVALVIGAVLFLRYSIDHGWLQPPVRVLIGIVSAVGLLLLCEMKAARRYPVTANALDAAAIAILFATVFAAHALWGLIPGSAAFVLLAVVTALAVLLSIRRESLFIAVLGLLGGFATPVLLSTGENRPIPLFTYLLLLNVGLAWVAYRKSWPVLTALTLVFTTIYQWGWVLRFLGDASELPLAMGIFIVFPLVTFAGVLISRRPRLSDAGSPADASFERTAIFAAIVPLTFGVFLAAVPAYGARASLLFGFLLLIDLGLLAISAVRAQGQLQTIAAGSTLVVMGVWLANSYVSDARLVVLGFVVVFVVLFLIAEPLASRLGYGTEESTVARYAAPTLLFVFSVLAYLEPAFVRPWPLFGTLIVVLCACAVRAAAAGDGYVYFIGAFFAVAAQAVWSVEHLDEASIGTAVAIYALFGVIAIAAPLAARQTGRAFEPAGGGGVVLLASLGLLLYLSTGPIAPRTLWALAFLLAVLNAGLFVESVGARLPVISIAGSLLSWIILSVWWVSAGGAIGVLPSLAVLTGLALVTMGGHAWAGSRAHREAGAADTFAGLVTSGLFLGLAGHLFLVALALNPEWSIPPWPLMGALGVMTLGATLAAVAARRPVLHAAAAAAAAAVIATWASAAAPAPWPATALLLSASAIAYALVTTRTFAEGPGREFACRGAAATLLIGEFSAMVASDMPGRPWIGWLLLANAVNVAILLGLTAARHWSHVAVLAAAATWPVVFLPRLPWAQQLALATVLYAVVTAFAFIVSRRAADRSPHLAAIVASAMFFFAGRQALIAGGHASVVGVVPVIAAAVLALLLRQLLAQEAPGARDEGRLALVTGASLAFVTVAIPVQLEHQWITIGWALEGAALAWLFTRVPHRGLLYFSLALLAAVFVRLAMNAEIFRYEPRGSWRVFNWYLYTYGVAASCFFAAAWWFSRTDSAIYDRRIQPSRLLPGAAVVLLFLLLNIEIADFYATGPEIMFGFGASVSQDLTYTIGWLAFGMLLLAAGIYAGSRAARIAAVALIAVTTFKCFLYDLASLEGLYRVVSFVGLGLSLALVSLALQKYVLAKPRGAR